MLKSVALALALLAGLAGPVSAESFRSEYVVTLFGLPVARSNFDTTIDQRRFSINGTVRSAGFAEFFDDTKGTIRSSGAIGEAGAANAALLAVSILALNDKALAEQLDAWRAAQTAAVGDAPQ